MDPFTEEGLRQAGLDTLRYEAVSQWSAGYAKTQPEAYRDFVGGWTGVAYRTISCGEHSQAFTHSIKAAGDAPPIPERYVQERELLCFFVSGLAAIESFCYAINAAGVMLQPRFFSLDNPERITPGCVQARILKAFPIQTLEVDLQELLADGTYEEWKDVRNILTHRVVPPRAHYFTNVTDKQQPSHWQSQKVRQKAVQLVFDVDATERRMAWLVSKLNRLLVGATDLAGQHR